MKSVEAYIMAEQKWQEELTFLRDLILKSELEEGIKWSRPVYMLEGKNVMGLSAFKDYVGIWFFQGVFLKDKKNLLQNAQEGKTVAMRQWRFHSMDEIKEQERTIKQYIDEAIQNQKDGKVIKPKRSQTKKPLIVPPLLKTALEENEVLKSHFENLSLTYKREFVEYIATAKREATKQKRLEKIIPMIINGEGLNDKYRK